MVLNSPSPPKPFARALNSSAYSGGELGASLLKFGLHTATPTSRVPALGGVILCL